MSMKMIDDDKIFKYVREKILGKEDIEKIVEKFKDSEEIYNVVKKLVDFFMLENYCEEDSFVFDEVRECLAEIETGKILACESEKSAVEAVENILQKIPATKKVLVTFTGDENKLDNFSINAAIDKISEKFSDAEIVWCVVSDDRIENEVRVVIVAD